MPDVPVIDLTALTDTANPPSEVVDAVADAASTYGFFQVTGHGVAAATVDELWRQTRRFFEQPIDAKRTLMRTKDNSRGYYDRELTKQRRDLKEVLDLAHVPYPDRADDDPANFHAIDGVNQWPDLPGFRAVMIDWLHACEDLSKRLLAAFAVALGEPPAELLRHFGPDHTSFVRLNHYPLGDLLDDEEAADLTPLGDMALHHHSDAGALTVLLQDDIGGLQVEHAGEWLDVEPVDGAFVINTGDMMQVWSNDRFTAALHRVAPRTNAARFSLPYFFNPSYATDYAPLAGSIAPGDVAHYRPLNWGDFRKSRADGDFADYGTEIQISQFRVATTGD